MVCILGHPLGSFRPPRCDFIMPVQCDRCVKTILCFPDNLQKNPCIPYANILFWFCQTYSPLSGQLLKSEIHKERETAGHKFVPGCLFCLSLFRNHHMRLPFSKKKNPSYSQPSASAISLHSFSEKLSLFNLLYRFCEEVPSFSANFTTERCFITNKIRIFSAIVIFVSSWLMKLIKLIKFNISFLNLTFKLLNIFLSEIFSLFQDQKFLSVIINP